MGFVCPTYVHCFQGMSDIQIKSFNGLISQLKLRMRHEQQAREEEQNNHVLMLRELQMLVSTERSAKEDLEQQLEDTKEQIMLIKKLPANKSNNKEYELKISQLQFELQEVQRRLKQAEKASSQPSPLLVQLQAEMSKMKKEHAEVVIREQKRANDAEERLRIITSLEECRVADLGIVQMVISPLERRKGRGLNPNLIENQEIPIQMSLFRKVHPTHHTVFNNFHERFIQLLCN